MQIGVMFPQNEIGPDVDNVRLFTQAAVDCGCGHIWATDHVLGADTSRRPDWTGPYGAAHEFHEPLLLFAYLAAICELELVTGVIILPQRQTVLVAKQAAELDLLCKGRLRLGVGVGWNEVEFEGLGMDFSTRGRRMEEQIVLMRKLWCEAVVDFDGEFDRIPGAAIAPRPLQQPIPIWMGAGSSLTSLRRVGRMSDGFLARSVPGPDSDLDQHLDIIRNAAIDAGRDPARLGLQGLLPVYGKSTSDIRDLANQWRDRGATHLTIDPRAVSLHVNQDMSMEDKLAQQKASTQILIDGMAQAMQALGALGA